MLYLYDQQIVDDLRRSFNPDNAPNPLVKVVPPEEAIGLAAHLNSDVLQFPIVALFRDDNTSIDTNRTNFSHMHFGVQSVLDPETNNLYYEKVIPITLSYHITILTTNIADRDELIKELIFKYTQMYFITFTLPYECKRKVRFGVRINSDESIEYVSSQAEYRSEGKLYQATIPMTVEGAVMVSYTPAKLKNFGVETEIVNP